MKRSFKGYVSEYVGYLSKYDDYSNEEFPEEFDFSIFKDKKVYEEAVEIRKKRVRLLNGLNGEVVHAIGYFKAPDKPCCYIIYFPEYDIMYIGSARNARCRMERRRDRTFKIKSKESRNYNIYHNRKFRQMARLDAVPHMFYIETKNIEDAKKMEQVLIKELRPELNGRLPGIHTETERYGYNSLRMKLRYYKEIDDTYREETQEQINKIVNRYRYRSAYVNNERILTIRNQSDDARKTALYFAEVYPKELSYVVDNLLPESVRDVFKKD